LRLRASKIQGIDPINKRHMANWNAENEPENSFKEKKSKEKAQEHEQGIPQG